jgi:hypothetical protein
MRPLITGDTAGTLYILCFARPIGNAANTRAMARHYLGWSSDLAHRLCAHRSGRGQPLTAAAVALGIGWEVYARPGTPALERYLKGHYKQTPLLCPHCAVSRGRRASYGFQPLAQLVMDLGETEELPDVVPGRMDWLELRIMQEWRSGRVPAPAGIDDLL